jgi:uncharacterized OB-fold protein
VTDATNTTAGSGTSAHDATSAPSAPFRVLPKLDDRNRDFWTGGGAGELRFWRCRSCRTYIHPPQPVCPKCLSKDMAVEPVSGRATLASYTINHQPWMPGPELPYVVAIVEIVEQPSLRLTTNLVDCALDAIAVGMPVRVTFEKHEDPDGDVYLPLFAPDPKRGVEGEERP